jgi:threonine aldolase
MNLLPMADLRSDTVTRPSPEMRRAIAEAEVGDAVLGDDPTVAELERVGAELLGKERALFFPSGIMANQTAIIAQAPPGSEVVIEAAGHILEWEDAAAAAWGGVQLRAVPTPDGLLTPERVEAAIRPASPFLPRTALLCLENTHNGAGGRVMPLAQMRAVAEVARSRGVPVHLDGARLPNAAAALGASLAELAGPADTVMMSLSKGLGAPVGSLLAGSADTMERAWRIRRRMGGGMRQAGLLAAGALWGLHHNLGRIPEDHRRAAELARAAAALPALSVRAPDTNIVMIDLADARLDAERLLAALEQQGVRMTRFGPRRLRAVTHLDVNDEGIRRAGAALTDAITGGLAVE